MPSAEDPYVLGRGAKASARLASQDLLFQRKNGWIIHPTISAFLKTKSPSDLRIADIAAGSGNFPLQFSEDTSVSAVEGSSNSKVPIIALDISDSQYPPDSLRPPNVSWKVWDAFSPVPKEYEGRFDVVHLRLICAAMLERGPKGIIQNLYKLLKPGGYLQWQEAVGNGFHPVEKKENAFRMIPDKTFDNMSRYQRAVDKGSLFFRSLVDADEFPKELAAGGFVDVVRHDMPIRPSLLGYETYLCNWAMKEIEEVTRGAKEVDKEHIKEYEEGWAELEKAVEGGQRWCYNVPVFVGRKPE